MTEWIKAYVKEYKNTLLFFAGLVIICFIQALRLSGAIR